MPIPANIIHFLHSNAVSYHHLTHSPAYTAQEIAQVQHVSGRKLAKTVMVMADHRLVMLVLPASHRLDMGKVKKLLEAKDVRLAREYEFERVFPECETGAMPPLGNLYHLDVWADEDLMEQAFILFNAGTHSDTIEIAWDDFERIVRPRIASFGNLMH